MQPIQPKVEDRRPKSHRDDYRRESAELEELDEVEIIHKSFSSQDNTLDSHVFGNVGLK